MHGVSAKGTVQDADYKLQTSESSKYENLKYLGFPENGNCNSKIWRQIGIVKDAFHKLSKDLEKSSNLVFVA